MPAREEARHHHFIDSDLGERPRKGVVRDAPGRDRIARVASRARGASLHHSAWPAPARTNRSPVFSDDRAASGSEATTTSASTGRAESHGPCPGIDTTRILIVNGT